MVRSLSLALNSADLGTDAAAEAFARCWQQWSDVAAMANPSGWVYRVGLNWGRSWMRRGRREVLIDTVGNDPVSADPDMGDPALVAAIAALKPKHRTVIVARYYLDWSEAEISTALKIPPGTVKSRLSRAIDHLARVIRSEK